MSAIDALAPQNADYDVVIVGLVREASLARLQALYAASLSSDLENLTFDQPGVFVPPPCGDQLASWIVSGAGGRPPRLLCGRTVL